MSLQGKVAVVTGASSGIGASIARTLASSGCSVVIAARRLDPLESLASQFPTVTPCQCDVTDLSSFRNLISTCESTYGFPDILINCAGVMYFTLMKNCKVEEWIKTVDVNCKGVLHGFACVVEKFIERGSGHIINISSDASKRMFPSLAVYCASKTFIDVLAEGTRRELVGTGVKITNIQPGDVKGTELIMGNTDGEAAEKMGVEIGKPVGEGFEREQLLDVEDVAGAVMYALEAPKHVAVNEVLIEPRDQE
ncbi:hypothetical protein TrVE_jg10785 [Triparma verrucosa]|uniref:NADP-dependent 3-hydroxy acid dehydrogenase YdfG n=2 Tax=Triparma TaxID=722752 RepID=A0A9W7A7P9_9STRA|nr:hypothetical protein TrST_g2495 [Triparma strigata]GMH91651.1 hypothetical protein TrVE_jg10785 [Triparma verrucosa]